MNNQIRIIVADDHPIFLAGLCNILQSEKDFNLLSTAVSGSAALKLIQEHVPDVAILDISMPEPNGIDLSRLLAKDYPNVQVLLLTLYEERSFLVRAVNAGAKGYILKRSAANNLVHAVRAVHFGRFYVDPYLTNEARALVEMNPEERPQLGGLDRLTEREETVIKFSARGLTNKEIAGQLQISEKTVETYKARASEKLELKTRAQLLRLAGAQGWLE